LQRWVWLGSAIFMVMAVWGLGLGC
jgi:hypothetical protein